ncbi:hypothetical protein ACW4TU_39930 [Streptomyces sp. QTS52]
MEAEAAHGQIAHLSVLLAGLGQAAEHITITRRTLLCLPDEEPPTALAWSLWASRSAREDSAHMLFAAAAPATILLVWAELMRQFRNQRQRPATALHLRATAPIPRAVPLPRPVPRERYAGRR